MAVNPFTGDDMFALAHGDCEAPWECMGCGRKVCPRCEDNPGAPCYCPKCHWDGAA